MLNGHGYYIRRCQSWPMRRGDLAVLKMQMEVFNKNPLKVKPPVPPKPKRLTNSVMNKVRQFESEMKPFSKVLPQKEITMKSRVDTKQSGVKPKPEVKSKPEVKPKPEVKSKPEVKAEPEVKPVFMQSIKVNNILKTDLEIILKVKDDGKIEVEEVIAQPKLEIEIISKIKPNSMLSKNIFQNNVMAIPKLDANESSEAEINPNPNLELQPEFISPISCDVTTQTEFECLPQNEWEGFGKIGDALVPKVEVKPNPVTMLKPQDIFKSVEVSNLESDAAVNTDLQRHYFDDSVLDDVPSFDELYAEWRRYRDNLAFDDQQYEKIQRDRMEIDEQLNIIIKATEKLIEDFDRCFPQF